MRRTLLIGILITLAWTPLFGAIYFEAPPDIAHLVNPTYPRREERSRIGGSGVFRLTVDPATGKVRNVGIVKSTGSDALDRATVFAFRQWRFKSGKRTTADISITFDASGTVILPPGPKLVPRR
jgi:TonB family protein